MATSEQFFVIILEQSTQAERDAVHARIKKATGTWWHKYSEVWIVRGGTKAQEWSDRLQPAMKNGPSALLVLNLPVDGTRTWAYFGPNPTDRAAWLHKTYTKDKR